MPSSVITAPLWGSESKQPEDITATPVQQFRADAGRVGQFQIPWSQGAERDAHAAGGGAGDAGQDVDRDRFEISGLGEMPSTAFSPPGTPVARR